MVAYFLRLYYKFFLTKRKVINFSEGTEELWFEVKELFTTINLENIYIEIDCSERADQRRRVCIFF